MEKTLNFTVLCFSYLEHYDLFFCTIFVVKYICENCLFRNIVNLNIGPRQLYQASLNRKCFSLQEKLRERKKSADMRKVSRSVFQ